MALRGAGRTPFVVTLGEALVSFSVASGHRLEDSRLLEPRVAGAELNVAIGLARLEVPVQFFGQVGDDPWGRRILAVARGEGVDVSGVTVHPDRPTGVMFKESVGLGSGVRVYYLRQGSAARLYRGSRDLESACRRARALHLTGISLSLGPSLRWACDRALQAAPRSILRVLDLNVRLRLASPEDWRSLLDRYLPEVNVLLATTEELLAVGLEPDAVVRRAAALGVTAVLRCGVAPTEVLVAGDREERFHVEPVSAERVVDTVGAGDAFASSLIAMRLEGADWTTAVRAGHLAGAMVVGGRGDYEGAPYRRELRALLGSDWVER